MLLRYDRYARFDRRPLMLRSAMIQPNLARSSVIKMRGRRSSCSETRTCATNLASFGGVGRPRAQDYLQAIRVGRRQTENSRRSWKEIRSDQRADPTVENIALAKLRRALAKRERPIVRRDPVQFLKPVSPDPTRTRLRVAKATIPPKATLDLILESSASDM